MFIKVGTRILNVDIVSALRFDEDEGRLYVAMIDHDEDCFEFQKDEIAPLWNFFANQALDLLKPKTQQPSEVLR